MPTAMEYAINTIVGLCMENTKLKMKVGGEVIQGDNDDGTISSVDWEKLKASADLIAEAQEKRIHLLEEDKKERMEYIQQLLKRIAELEKELELIPEPYRKLLKEQKKSFGSPFMEDPSPTINGVLRQ